MSEESLQIVVDLAKKETWKRGSDVSAQTKAAQRISLEWQKDVLAHFGKRFRNEYPVAPLGNERIDLVDETDGIAFELKVSPNNVHFEFYRDIFKVAVHNRESHSLKIKRLVFITPEEGVAKLRSSFVKSVSAIAGEQLGFEVEVVGI
jgi:hypothetical protein